MSKIAFAAVSLALLGATVSTNHINLNSLSTTGVKQPAKVVTASVKKTQPAAPAPVVVTVQAGDTLEAIAEAHNTTYTRLFDANSFITDPNIINVGDQIRIPDLSEQLTDRGLPATTAPVVTTASQPAATRPVVTTAVSVPVVGNDAKAFIYAHESGNNPAATSPNGCFGLGQNCNGTVRALCGVDYACQDAYFTNYAISRYGSWEAAASFWQANGWW